MEFLKRIYNWVYPSYHSALSKATIGFDSILDVGCGTKSPLMYVRGEITKVGVDAHLPSIEISKAKGIHDSYINAQFSELNEKCSENSFECVLANDVLEHLDYESGMAFLDDLERIAKKRIIIFTPNGFVPQRPYNNNPWMLHKSGWTSRSMESRGYKVAGINGIKSLRGELCSYKHKPLFFWKAISWLSQFYTSRNPAFAYQIFCVKDL